MKKEYHIQPNHAGLCVRDYARSVLGLSARTLKNAKYNGSITVTGMSVHTNYVLRAGDVLCFNFPDAGSSTVLAENIPLSVLYEDEDILAVDKPSGMASHPTLTHTSGTLANAVLYYYRTHPFTFRLLTRLDADTTGVAIIAKNALFAAQFPSLQPQKSYYALCVGTPPVPQGLVDAPIDRAPDSILARCVAPCGKPSQTEYRVLSEKNGLSLVEAVPLTGRTHQIRLHLAHIGCPLYGDFLYGTEIPGERTRLHCHAVSFDHPQTGKRMMIEAPLPADFSVYTETSCE